MIITTETIEAWGAQYFPHLTPKYQYLAVLAVLGGVTGKEDGE